MAGGQIGVVHDAPRCQVVAQLLDQRGRQDGDAVLVALAGADQDLAAFQVKILDAQAQAFEQSHAGAVEQLDDGARRAMHVAQQRGRFALGEHGRQPLAFPGAHDVV